MTTAAVTPRRMALIGAALVTIGPISLSIYTPVMPELAAALETNPAAIKLSLTLYLAGFALAQLVCGPLSDRYGRRPILLAFTGLYVVGALAALVAPDVRLLILGRVLQGIGACAGVALSRAMVRDCFEGQAAARMMSTIGMILSVAPAVAPLLGAGVVGVAGWRALFALLALYGLTLALWIARVVPETNLRPDPDACRPGRLAANYLRLARSRAYARHVLLVGLSLGGLYTFNAVVPFVLIDEVGLTPGTFGLVMLAVTAAYFAGATLTNRLLRRVEARRLIAPGNALVLASGLLLAALLALGPPSVPAVILPMMLWAFGMALTLPGAMTESLAPFPHMAGAASALMGFCQMGMGVLGSAVAALIGDAATALAIVPAAMAVSALAAFAALGAPAARPAAAPAPSRP